MIDSRERAFPNQPHGQNGYQSGLTKRELFAAMAMQALASNPEETRANTLGVDDEIALEASIAVRMADALIAELSK